MHVGSMNWGSEHAHRWCWMHAGRLGEDGLGWLDLALVRIRIGPLVSRRGSVADARIALEIPGGGTRSLAVSGSAAVEHGSPAVA